MDSIVPTLPEVTKTERLWIKGANGWLSYTKALPGTSDRRTTHIFREASK
jgi:hypothetical protein